MDRLRPRPRQEAFSGFTNGEVKGKASKSFVTLFCSWLFKGFCGSNHNVKKDCAFVGMFQHLRWSFYVRRGTMV